jgi:hypothetical protein
MNLIHFESWADVLAYARAGQTLFYQAPLDRRPMRFVPADPRRPTPFTYEVRARTIRMWPSGSVGRGRARTSDPFTADAGHLARFSHPIENGQMHERRTRGRHEGQDAAEFREWLEKIVILVGGEAEGSIDVDDDDSVFVGIVVNVTGYGPHVGAIYAMQNRFHGNLDTPLQEAHEILEQWEMDHNPDYFAELEREHGDEASSVFTETFDGRVWELSASDFAAAIKGTDAEKYIDVHSSRED